MQSDSPSFCECWLSKFSLINIFVDCLWFERVSLRRETPGTCDFQTFLSFDRLLALLDARKPVIWDLFLTSSSFYWSFLVILIFWRLKLCLILSNNYVISYSAFDHYCILILESFCLLLILRSFWRRSYLNLWLTLLYNSSFEIKTSFTCSFLTM